jgi:hypothetical protein
MSHCCDWSIGAACGPDQARGLVLGLHASSLAGGGALASSLTGMLVDRWAPGPAVLVVGTVGIRAAAFSGRSPAPRRALPRRRLVPQRVLMAAAADSAAMNVSPACAPCESAQRKSVLRPTIRRPDGPGPWHRIEQPRLAKR